MSLPTHPLLSLLKCTATGLKSMLTHYIDATVDSQFASLRNSIETMIQSGVIGPNCDGTHFGMTLPPQTHTNTDQSSDECSHEYSNDKLTRAQKHQNILQNEVSLSNPINTESMIKQEFDEEEDDGEEMDNVNVAKWEKCENRICTSGHDAEMGENPHYQSHSIGYEPELDPEILAQVKQEIKEEENEMIVKNVMDNTQQIEDCDESEEDMSEQVGHIALSNQVNTSSTDAHHLLHNGDEQYGNQPIDDDHQPNGQVNNDTDSDTFLDGWAKDEMDLDGTTHDYKKSLILDRKQTHNADGSNASSSSNVSLKHSLTNEEDEEAQVNHDTQQLGGDTNNGQMVQIEVEEEDENEETEIEDSGDDKDESQTVEDAQIETTQPPHNQKVVRQSARHLKRIQTDKVNNQGQTENEDDQVDDESSRHVKRTRMDSTQQNDAIGEESIATECTTNPIQLNLAQPNRHFQCSHCSKSFDYLSILQTHLRVHTGERPFQCDQCDKRFNQNFNLTRHQLIHQNIKSFQCDQCDKQFTQKVNLESHQRSHSGERPYQCRFCDKFFAQLGPRITHEQAIHLHVKPYRCKQCGHSATKQSDIITHIRTVHFGLPRTIKKQKALNIVDERNPEELVEKV